MKGGASLKLTMERPPKQLYAAVCRALRQAWQLDDADKAEKLIKKLARRSTADKEQSPDFASAPFGLCLVRSCQIRGGNKGRTAMLYRSSICAIGAALSMAISGAQAADDNKYPDLKGQWERFVIRGVNGQFDQTKPQGRGQQAPLTPEYQHKADELRATGKKDHAAVDTGALVEHLKTMGISFNQDPNFKPLKPIDVVCPFYGYPLTLIEPNPMKWEFAPTKIFRSACPS